MSTVDPWDHARHRRTTASGSGRVVGTAVAGLACLTLSSLVTGVPTAAAQPVRGGDAPQVSVIVESEPGAGQGLARAVAAAGGSVVRELAVVDGVHARVPADAVTALRTSPGVAAVTPDADLVPLGGRWGDDTTGESRRASGTGAWQAPADLGSAWSVARQVGAHDVWAQRDPAAPGRRITGHDVEVAVIDTGVAEVEGLLTPGKLRHGPDLSFDSQSEGTRGTDGLGHGTHMAALVAGRDSAVRPGKEADPRSFVGIAPDARVVSVKVGAGDGGVDVSQVIAGIDWVVSHRDSHDIRVINLSYGTASTQPYTLDPLAHAVESAWHAGIVVVVAAGNDGEDGATALTMPAADPYVIAVGSSDHRGSRAPRDTRVGAWTNPGTDARRPDLLAPGKSVVSLRVPGSLADTEHPEGLVPGDASGRFFRGTGTSQSAAVVSGAVALLLQADPDLTPDQVKGLLVATADRLPGDGSPVQGAGTLDVDEAVARALAGGVPAATQTAARTTGLGSLEAARGGSHVVDPLDGSVLVGEQDVFGVAWDPQTWSTAAAAGRSWSGGEWNGSGWTGRSWSGRSWSSLDWSGRSWSGRSWSGRSWSDHVWSGRSWSDADWAGRSWSGRSWSGRSWSGRSWSGRSWSADDWSGRSWSGRSWSAEGWSGRSWS